MSRKATMDSKAGCRISKRMFVSNYNMTRDFLNI